MGSPIKLPRKTPKLKTVFTKRISNKTKVRANEVINEKKSNYLLLLGMFLLSAILYRHLFSAGLSWIDDHEFASYLDQNGHLGFLRIFSALAHETELKNITGSLRYRPIYFFVRVTETYLFHLSALPRFIVRIFLSSFTVVLLTNVATSTQVPREKNHDWILKWALAISLLSQTCWSDITTRLGPSELELLVGLAIFLTGFIEINKGRTTPNLKPFLFVLAGLTICAGAKENGLFLLIPAIYILKTYGFPKRFRVGCKYLTGIILIYCFAIAGILIRGLSKNGTDLYWHKRTVGSLVDNVSSALQSTHVRNIVGVLLILLVLNKRQQQVARIQLVVMMLFLVVADYVFYFGDPSSSTRYLAMSQVGMVMSYGVLAAALFDFFIDFQEPKRSFIAITATLGLLLACSGVVRGWQTISRAVQSRYETSHNWQNQVNNIRAASQETGANQIIILAEGPSQFELSASIGRFTRVLVPHSHVYLMVSATTDEYPLNKALLASMQEVSLNGYSEWAIEKLSIASPSAQ